MTPIALGDGMADTNSTPGPKQRIFYAILSGNKIVSMDAPNLRFSIREVGMTGNVIATASGATADVSLTGGTGRTAVLNANSAEAQMQVVGLNGSVNCATILCNGKALAPREEDWCNAAGTQKGKIMILASAPYNITNV